MRSLPLPARLAADGLLAVVLAPRCLSCDRPLDSPTLGPVCDPCWRSIAPLPAPLCGRCGEPVPGWGDGEDLCSRCRRTGGGSVALGRSAGSYEGTLRRLLHALKYEGRRTLAPRIASLMRERCGAVLAGADLLVPVPLHWRRRWARGFNQAHDLASHLGLPVRPLLVRRRATPPQVGLPAARRHRNMRGAFAARRRPDFLFPGTTRASQVKGKVVVLVDDVATTGATLEACGAVLLLAGAKEVRAITAARARVRRRLPR